MQIPGRVKEGVVLLDGANVLPEGAEVIVLYSGMASEAEAVKKPRIEVPLVQTGQPGTVDLTTERIAEILGEEDGPPPTSG